jgi:hypothetical protein
LRVAARRMRGKRQVGAKGPVGRLLCVPVRPAPVGCMSCRAGACVAARCGPDTPASNIPGLSYSTDARVGADCRWVGRRASLSPECVDLHILVGCESGWVMHSQWIMLIRLPACLCWLRSRVQWAHMMQHHVHCPARRRPEKAVGQQQLKWWAPLYLLVQGCAARTGGVDK